MVKMKACIHAVQRILFTSIVTIRKSKWFNNSSGLITLVVYSLNNLSLD